MPLTVGGGGAALIGCAGSGQTKALTVNATQRQRRQSLEIFLSVGTIQRICINQASVYSIECPHPCVCVCECVWRQQSKQWMDMSDGRHGQRGGGRKTTGAREGHIRAGCEWRCLLLILILILILLRCLFESRYHVLVLVFIKWLRRGLQLRGSFNKHSWFNLIKNHWRGIMGKKKKRKRNSLRVFKSNKSNTTHGVLANANSSVTWIHQLDHEPRI